MERREVEEAEGGGVGAGAAPRRGWWRRERPGMGPDGGDGGRREESGRGGEHEHKGGERMLTVLSEEAREHWSRPATGGRGGAGLLTVAAA